MKKSGIIYMHILFWVIILATNFVSPFILKYLSPKELGTIALYKNIFNPVFFYIGYIGIMRIKWTRRNIIYMFFTIALGYLALFLISKRIFSYGIAPLSSVFLWTSIGCLFRIFIDWFKKRNEVLVLEKENVESNLALLKSQINPHFLFNTLHNIDALIYDNQEKASSSLEKLASIMRYMINETKSDWVELMQEIKHLKDYISLEQLRLKNRKFVNYSLIGECKGVKIAPMLMIPFVENAFKHSIDSKIENGIIIEIYVEGNVLNFTCRNIFDPLEKDKDEGCGIGLETVKKRLELIYPQKHKLEIKTEKSIYKVKLEIQLDEN